jgi:GAF domain-containing protein
MRQDLPDDAFERLFRVTKLLNTHRTLPAKLEAVVEMVKRTIPGCDAAGVVMLIEGHPTTSAVTDRLTVEVDLVQYETADGPCLAAVETGNVIRVDILERDSRFTRFAPGALDLQIQSTLSVPLVANGTTVGALNLYSRTPDAFHDEDEEAVKPLADYAAEAMSTSPLYAFSLDMVDGMVEVMEDRARIEQAIGVIMASEHRSNQEAFDRLRRLALSSGESMRQVSEWVLEERPRGDQPSFGEDPTLPGER